MLTACSGKTPALWILWRCAQLSADDCLWTTATHDPATARKRSIICTLSWPSSPRPFSCLLLASSKHRVNHEGTPTSSTKSATLFKREFRMLRFAPCLISSIAPACCPLSTAIMRGVLATLLYARMVEVVTMPMRNCRLRCAQLVSRRSCAPAPVPSTSCWFTVAPCIEQPRGNLCRAASIPHGEVKRPRQIQVKRLESN